MATEFLVTQTAYFTWKVTAMNEQDAIELVNQLGYEDAYSSCAEDIRLEDVEVFND